MKFVNVAEPLIVGRIAPPGTSKLPGPVMNGAAVVLL